MKNVHFDLINNAKDSLKTAIELLAWPDSVTSYKYKQAILRASHCVELILKERLRRVHPAFVWENVDKYPSLSARTVTSDKALSRLETLDEVQFDDKDKRTISALRNMRNAIEHYEFTLKEKEAKVALGRVLSFIFLFASNELSLDLTEKFKEDDTWEMLITEMYEFASSHAENVSKKLSGSGIPIDTCKFCGYDTVDLLKESCVLCGHWYDPNENDMNEI
jgi:rubrerythrin